MFVLYLDVGKRGEVRGYAGASVNLLVRSDVYGTLDGAHFDSAVSNFNDVDYAGVVGAAGEYRLNTVSFVLDVRFVGSLASVVSGADAKLRAFEFTLGLGIPLGKDHF
jgi:hypothetical protein